jgi:outer membrane biosynthesis protein TonB
VEPRRFIRSGIAASAIGHLSILTAVLIFTEVHPFGTVTAEPITVDLVSPDEAAKKAEPVPTPKPEPSDSFDLSSKSAPSSSPAPAAAPAAATQPQKQATLSTPSLNRQEAQQANAQPQPPSTSPLPAHRPPEPDLSIKYHVLLGLPPDLPPSPEAKSGDFDAPASKTADIASSLIAEFRRHLKTCSRLPGSIAPSDKVKVTLRVLMTPEGRLAAEPTLIEASASMKGPALMQGAITALQACQPYAMLPADRYGEWKVLDLSFTPQDFSGSS